MKYTKLYCKKPNNETFKQDAFDRNMSLSAMGLYFVFSCHPILSIEEIQEFSKENKDDILIFIEELLRENLIQVYE